ncbi:MAG TPA: peroxiredoxin [Minicystis sp.]|nr:peroxiredoxin [Minicystis sp.]
MLEVGAQAPDFAAKDHHGREVSLARLLEQGPVVLYFYSRDFTPICTREACAFRDAYEELRDLGAQVVGVSADADDSHRRFAAAHQIPFPLVGDPDRAIQRAYGAFRVFGLFNQRLTFVIDRAGVVRAAIHHEMRASRHAEDVRQALRSLRGPAG